MRAACVTPVLARALNARAREGASTSSRRRHASAAASSSSGIDAAPASERNADGARTTRVRREGGSERVSGASGGSEGGVGDGGGRGSAQAGRRAARRRRANAGKQVGSDDGGVALEEVVEKIRRKKGPAKKPSTSERWADERNRALGTALDPSVRLDADEVRELCGAIQKLLLIERAEEELREEEDVRRQEASARLGVVEALALAERNAKESKALFESMLTQRAGFTDAASMRAAVRQGKAARKKLISQNIELVAKIASQMYHAIPPGERRSMSREDMIHEGVTGLVRAAEKFDPTRGYAFSTYAYAWTKQAVTRSVYNNGRTIRVPEHVLRERKQVYDLSIKMEQELGRLPTVEEIAIKTRGKFSSSKLNLLAEISKQQPMSLDLVGLMDDARDANESVSGFGRNQMTGIEGDQIDQIEHEVELELLRLDVKAAVDALPEKEAIVVRHRYGLNGSERMTYTELGKRVGNKSGEHARQLEKSAVESLKSNGLLGLESSKDAQPATSDRDTKSATKSKPERKRATTKPPSARASKVPTSKSALDLVRSIDLG